VKPTVKPTPAPTSESTKPLEIKPPVTDEGSGKSSVTVNNVKPGQKIKVTVIESNNTPTPKATPKSTTSNAPKSNFKVTTKDPVKVVPKPSGAKANVGISNLKPGQKIKVTVKTGGTKK
jgi:hypothetical protein